MSSGVIEAPRNLSSALVETLQQAATMRDGKVLLRSRLFAQWLHYAFPHECPYPFAHGKINPLSPSDWSRQHGHGIYATESEKNLYVTEQFIGDKSIDANEAWMS